MQGRQTKALLDSGAQISLTSRKLYDQLEHTSELTDKLEGIIQDVKIGAKLFEGVIVSFNNKAVFI